MDDRQRPAGNPRDGDPVQDELVELRQRIAALEQQVQQRSQDGDGDTRSLRGSIRSLKQRQDRLERKIDQEYRPALQREQETLDTVLEVMRELKDRLGAYGRMQKTLRNLQQDIDDLDRSVAAKVGHSEFDDTTTHLEEQVRRIKARLDHIED